MFCIKCGTEISENAAFCQGCGNPITGKVQEGVCHSCGVELPDTAAFCHACGNPVSGSAGATAQTRATRTVPAFSGARRTFPVGPIVVATIGAILMLIALAPDWYTVRCAGDDCYGATYEVDFDNLMNDTDIMDVNWAGAGLPLVFLIIFASVILLSVCYSLFSRTAARKLWIWLGSLSIILLLINFGYLLSDALTEDVGSYDVTPYITPHAGFVLALIGVIAVLVGAGMAKQKR